MRNVFSKIIIFMRGKKLEKIIEKHEKEYGNKEKYKLRDLEHKRIKLNYKIRKNVTEMTSNTLKSVIVYFPISISVIAIIMGGLDHGNVDNLKYIGSSCETFKRMIIILMSITVVTELASMFVNINKLLLGIELDVIEIEIEKRKYKINRHKRIHDNMR